MQVPDEYHGREQTYLKHEVLRRYLEKWGFKLGSTARRRPLRIWYVDCFAGPWRSESQQIDDTSVSIGLAVMNGVLAEWRKRNLPLAAGAIFVEENPGSFLQLREHVQARRGNVDVHVFDGAFGDVIDKIEGLLKAEPAFIFVDPTGWKGAGMVHISRLVRRPCRDVMINFMYQYINRFKGESERAWLRTQLCEFFGIDDNSVLAGLEEDEIVAHYCQSLKKTSGLEYALDLAVPDPTRDRTFFHLVVGGRHPDVVSLFRDVEAAVVGVDAAAVREGARRRKEEKATSQLGLSLPMSDTIDSRYRELHEGGLVHARETTLRLLAEEPLRYGNIWPKVLEGAHIRKGQLASVVEKLLDEGAIAIERIKPGKRLKDGDRLRRIAEDDRNVADF